MERLRAEDAETVRRRPGGRSARVVKDVLDATIEELVEVGYSEFNLESVACRAGVHKTTVYRRWGNRESLIVAALLEHAEKQKPVPDTGSLRSDLEVFIGYVVESSRTPENEAIIRTFAATVGRNTGLDRVATSFWQTRLARTDEIVARAKERGELPKQANAELLMEIVIGPIMMRLLITGEPLTKKFVKQVVDLALNGARRQDS